ncbi:MAG: TrkA family potassium uptake protein [Eubacteriales bacterium]|nr:TrkA family potassium uptake protein [Eubacteriales bacterium]
MRIAIAGGRSKADFLIGSLLKKGHKIVVINNDANYCRYLAATHKALVYNGDPRKQYSFEDAQVQGFDLIIALTPSDAENLYICQVAKRILGIKRAVAIVINPKNVDVFKKLGVNTAISATYMLANIIEQASTFDVSVNSVSIEHDQIVLTEILLKEDSPACGKTVSELSLPEKTILSCILHESEMLAPTKSTLLKNGDKLIILSDPSVQQSIIASITGGH